MRILDKNRKSYKKTFSQKTKCVFCSPGENLICEGIKGIYWEVVVSRYPYMDGNVMIVPIRHIENTIDVKKEEWEEFGEILKKTQTILSEAFKVKSFNIALNIGPESGASIPHIHWQLIPRRFKNITALNTFADLYLVGTTPKETHKIINKIAKEKIKKK